VPVGVSRFRSSSGVGRVRAEDPVLCSRADGELEEPDEFVRDGRKDHDDAGPCLGLERLDRRASRSPRRGCSWPQTWISFSTRSPEPSDSRSPENASSVTPARYPAGPGLERFRIRGGAGGARRYTDGIWIVEPVAD
jgi:hypothetical protein